MKYTYILLLLFCFSCQQEKTPMKMLYGKWKAAKWEKRNGVTNFDVSMIQFEFLPDSIYKTRMGMQSEEGTFNLKDNCFNAMSVYGVPKKCPILKLSQDTMVWMMDSVQQPGNLYLVRVKE